MFDEEQARRSIESIESPRNDLGDFPTFFFAEWGIWGFASSS
jgi:hypothetical protein